MVAVGAGMALGAAVNAAAPGDCLIVADGAYGPLTITAKGTATGLIQVRAMNLLKASVTALQFTNAEYVVVQGFSISTILFVNSNYSRVTRCQVRGPSSGYWVRVEEQKGCMSGCSNTPPGTSNHARVDHCDIGGGSSSSDIFNPTAFATNTRIDHNYIHDTSAPHLMTLGCCGPKYDYFESGTIIEHNLFVNANGTSAEMISIKGANVHFRYNTIRRHNGDIDIRAGRNNAIYGNFILGPGPGIRMYEDNHKIYNNYVNGGLTGNRSGPIHAPLKNALIVHNTFTGGVAVGNGNNIVANNILLGGGGGSMGNLSGSAESLGLVQMGDILTITATSKAVGAAVGSYPFVMDDIAGHPRGMKPDVGAQQFSTNPPLRRVLTTADVGPMAP
jgi:poly(beta-D-mannuronate) lyase